MGFFLAVRYKWKELGKLLTGLDCFTVQFTYLTIYIMLSLVFRWIILSVKNKIEFLKYTFYANQVNYKADIHIFR